MDWNAIVAANVKRLRVKKGLTQEQLAHDAEIDLTYLGGIERARRNPSVAVLEKIACALECKANDLFEPC